MRRASKSVVVSFLVLAAGLGCYPGVSDVETFDSVTTLRDSSATFSTAVTFALADSVVHLVGPGEDDDEITRVYDDQILQQIRDNMIAAGYSEVLNPTTADLSMVTLATSSTYIAYYWDYWCSYWDWWYASWGCYYPTYWYPYEYTLGTLLIGMADNREQIGDSPKSPLIWFSAANGLLTGQSTLARITTAIDQAFDQSPYIHHP